MADRHTLQAGQRYNLVLEFIENSGNAQVRLEWSSANQPREVIPQSQLYPTTGLREAGAILVEHWMNLAGTNVSALLAVTSYPNRPDGREFLTSFECLQTNWADNYGTRASGFLLPPTNGSYVFAVAGDDAVQLFLSTDATAAHKQLIQIAKALSANASVLLLDEPTSSLTQYEVKNLFSILRELKNEGVGIIFHRYVVIHARFVDIGEADIYELLVGLHLPALADLFDPHPHRAWPYAGHRSAGAWSECRDPHAHPAVAAPPAPVRRRHHRTGRKDRPDGHKADGHLGRPSHNRRPRDAGSSANGGLPRPGALVGPGAGEHRRQDPPEYLRAS
jgi:hypothetical protein